jgi:hypothetical protein
MTAVVHGTGIAVRLATDDEVAAVAATQHGQDLILTPPRSSVWGVPERPLGPDDVLVVSQAFVDFVNDGAAQCWRSSEHHGHGVPTNRDATIELLRLAEETFEDLIDLLGEMRIAGLGVSRWELMSAPRRIDLDDGLVERLAPLRRG